MAKLEIQKKRIAELLVWQTNDSQVSTADWQCGVDFDLKLDSDPESDRFDDDD